MQQFSLIQSSNNNTDIVNYITWEKQNVPLGGGRPSPTVECHSGFRYHLSLHIENLRKSELNAISRLEVRERNKMRYSVKLLHRWWECKLVQPLWMSVWWFLRKVGNNLTQDPVIPLLSKYAQSYHKDICSTMFIAVLFVIARTWKEPKCPSTKE